MSDPFQNQTGRHETGGSAVAADAGAAKDAALDAKNAAAGVADAGKQAATEVAQTGKNAARDVAQQTKEQASDLLGKTKQQLTEQVEAQQSSIVDTLRTLGDQLASMTANTDQHGTAVDVAGQARDRARGAADWLDERDPDQVLDELRRVGRERPGAFLLGAALAGVVAGRLTRGVVAVHTDDTDDSTDLTSSTGSTGSLPSTPPRPYIAPTTDSRPAPGRHEAPGTVGTVGTTGWIAP